MAKACTNAQETLPFASTQMLVARLDGLAVDAQVQVARAPMSPLSSRTRALISTGTPVVADAGAAS